ncbi:MAG: alpha/beta hydrolase [Cyclobacteriaceae bacterium]|nr:alpha/beta hydrolase [Cyclobacteriaceae bacterium]
MMTRSILLLGILVAAFWSSWAQSIGQFSNGPYILYYEEFGKGPPLYVFSGGPGEPPKDPYLQIIDSLKSTYTCVLLHQRGTGLSRGIPMNASTVTIANYVQDVERMRQKRGDQKVILLGVSWGGLLAMAYAAEYPDRISNLVLLCSAPLSIRHWNALYGNQRVRRSNVELDSMVLLQEKFKGYTERELDSLKRTDPSSPAVLAYKTFIRIHVRAMFYRRDIDYRKIDDLFYGFNFQAIPLIDSDVVNNRLDLAPRLKKLKAPALILYGRQDDQGEAVFYEQKATLKNSQMFVIEECGHEMTEDQPVEFFRILLSYLRVNPRR